MVKVGLRMSSSRRLSPLARPLMKTVLPAPRSPIKPSSSPPSRIEASRRPHDLVSCGERLSITIVTTVAESVAALGISITHPLYNATTELVLQVQRATRRSGRPQYNQRAPSLPLHDPLRSRGGKHRARARRAGAY